MKYWDIKVIKLRLPEVELSEFLLPGLDDFIKMRKPLIKPPKGFEQEVE